MVVGGGFGCFGLGMLIGYLLFAFGVLWFWV